MNPSRENRYLWFIKFKGKLMGKERGQRPALLVATPVGFVNAAESKECVRALDVLSITCVGTRGGTPVAVVNEMMEMTVEK